MEAGGAGGGSLELDRLQELAHSVQHVADSIYGRFGRALRERQPACVLFSGVGPGSGNSSVTAATAMALSLSLGLHVTLLEADAQEPALASRLGLVSAPGFGELISGRADLADCLREVDRCPGLSVVPAGAKRPPKPGDLVSDRARAILGEIKEPGRLLLIDGPPLAQRPESRIFMELADAAVLVFRARRTRRKEAEQTIEVLRSLDLELLGVVFNDYRSDLPFGIG